MSLSQAAPQEGKIIPSADESRLLRDLHCLRSPSRIQLVEEPARMRLHRILAHREPLGDLAVAEPIGDELQDLVLAWCDAEPCHSRRIGCERYRGLRWRGGGHRDQHFLDDHGLPGTRHPEAEPDAEGREEESDEGAVDLDRVLDDEE